MIDQRSRAPMSVAVVMGTRPEVIKLWPVIQSLRAQPMLVDLLVICTSQHAQMAEQLATSLGIRIDIDLGCMAPNQTLSGLLGRILAGLDPVLSGRPLDMVLVQGDTTTALAGAVAAFHRGIPVAHVEAGLRTGNPLSPFPEEMNRRLIGRLSALHLAPTAGSRKALLDEGVPASRIVVTGNPVVDALAAVVQTVPPSPAIAGLLETIQHQRILVLTTHRRESIGPVMEANLSVIRDFVRANPDMCLVFPVHPNPHVQDAAARILGDCPRIHLIAPLPYPDFVHLLGAAWLLLSDSGGIQEEAPSLGKPLLVLRDATERPEVVACGTAQLVGTDPARLAALLIEANAEAGWMTAARTASNPFGNGDSGRRIADAVTGFLTQRREPPARPAAPLPAVLPDLLATPDLIGA